MPDYEQYDMREVHQGIPREAHRKDTTELEVPTCDVQDYILLRKEGVELTVGIFKYALGAMYKPHPRGAHVTVMLHMLHTSKDKEHRWLG